MTEHSAICFEGVSKRYGRWRRQILAVDNISLAVAPRQVYGFLGPNGAGKTTSIRMLVGLIRPSTGKVALFGQPVRQQPEVLFRRVGALVEGAAFYEYLSGWKNLAVLARTGACHDPARIATLLAQVGLSERADDPVRTYSTGMKQRLGIAASLLNDPDLVVLDEPTSGLDPAGIQEIRVFIRDLVDRQGKTVFLSSHLLSEVEQICDRVAIIHRGKLVREGTVTSLLEGQVRLRVEAAPLEAVPAALSDQWPVSLNGAAALVGADRAAAPAVLSRLIAANIKVYQLTPERLRLEEVFLAATQEDTGDA